MVQSSPKFADIEIQTYGMDPNDLETKISKKTKAIIPVHYGGLPCKIDEIKEISNKNKFYLIEDAAESFGASLNGRKIGSFGTVSILSFAGNKILTTGEGGALCTDSKQLYEKIKLIRSHGRRLHSEYFSSMQDHDYFSLGYNWRMSSMTAALGLSQFDKLNRIIQLRRRLARFYALKSKKIKEIKTILFTTNTLSSSRVFEKKIKSKKIIHQFFPFDKDILWITLMFISTLIPTFLHFLLAIYAIMARFRIKPHLHVLSDELKNLLPNDPDYLKKEKTAMSLANYRLSRVIKWHIFFMILDFIFCCLAIVLIMMTKGIYF